MVSFFAAAIILLIVLIFLGTTVYAGVIAAPFIATPKRVIRKALKIADLKQGEKFYDLGSGTGKSLILAAREFGAISVGYELSLPVYFLSKINVLINKCGDKVSVFWRNFYHQDVSEADVIFCWLTPKAFIKLESKFNKEVKSGTRVITLSSPLLFWKSEKVLDLGEDGKLFFYTKYPTTGVLLKLEL